MKTAESFFESLYENCKISLFVMNKSPELGNVKSKSYKKQNRAHFHRYKQFTKVSFNMVEVILSWP